MPSAGFEPAIPEIKRLQTDTLNGGLQPLDFCSTDMM
jgi:hypothetical protein